MIHCSLKFLYLLVVDNKLSCVLQARVGRGYTLMPCDGIVCTLCDDTQLSEIFVSQAFPVEKHVTGRAAHQNTPLF